MKKILSVSLSILFFAALISSCSAPKNTVSTSVSRGKFIGTWTLTNVNYDGLLPGAVQDVFNQATPQAFVGSVWQLTNSGNGIYTLSDGTSQTIYWSVYNGDANGTMFQFKKLYQGDKAQKVDQGYRLVIANNDGTSMTLKSPIAIGDKTGYIVYSFSKK